MGNDWNYYYDFNRETKIEAWKEIAREGKFFTFASHFTCPEEDDYVILIPFSKLLNDTEDDSTDPTFITAVIDDKSYSFRSDIESAYISKQRSRQGFRVHLAAGDHTMQIQLSYSGNKNPGDRLDVRYIKDFSPADTVKGFAKTIRIAHKPFPQVKNVTPDLTDYIPGAGCVNTPGRFGFSKGDGVLDCAMPALGVIDKMYLCGHPKYNKPFRWCYSTLPENATLHGSYHPAVTKIDHDTFKVNHMGVNWATKFNGKDFSCTYSLGTAGVITESQEGQMRLSSLEFAGNYQYVIIPVADGEYKILSLDEAEKGFTMAENFLVLFGATEFPDLPLMITLDKSPDRLEVKRCSRTARLKEIIFHGTSRMITATPYGMESPEPISPDNTEFLDDLLQRCHFWSHAFMAYPVKCEEYYRVDEEQERVHIIQKFSYRYLTDEWNTAPMEIAPLPPVTSLCGTTVTDDNEDFRYATKFGWLRGAYGNTSSYSIPFMLTKRKYPLRDAADDTPEKLLAKCMDDYFKFAGQFPDTIQAYPYAGSLMEPFAMASTMFLFMTEEHRKQIREYAASRLKGASDANRQYDYPVINWGTMMDPDLNDETVAAVYKDPAMNHKKLWNWYQRTEPFTNAKFNICYLNVYFLSENVVKTGAKEEIAGMKIPLIENDWGVGLTFYYMMLCALASGDFTPVRENWELIKSVYKFFDCMHDWACMGTGYSDNAILWAEGANYGAFTGFVNMAEAIGDEAERKRGIYFAAKQLALRMAIIRVSYTYYCKMYDVPPWYITRFMHEEATPFYQFTNASSVFAKNRFRPGGIYNFTTEGLYPEIFDALRKYCPEDHALILDQLHDIFRTDPDNQKFRSRGWVAIQQINCMLMDEALNSAVSKQQVQDDIQFAEEHEYLMKKWRGIRIFSRRLPEEYFKAQLLAWNNMKDHPVWMEHWENMVMDDAVFAGNTAEIRFRKHDNGKCKIRLGCRKAPVRVTLNDVPVDYTMIKPDVFTVEPETNGVLKVFFE